MASEDRTAACTCDPAGLPNVTDAQCPQHGVLAFLMSGAAAEPDDLEPAGGEAARMAETARAMVTAYDGMLGASFWIEYGALKSEIEEFERGR